MIAPAPAASREEAAPEPSNGQSGARTRRRFRWLPLACLWIAVAALWALFFYRYTPTSWSVPVGYRTDSLNQLAIIHAASQGEYLPLIWKNVPQLGAPGSANWNDMPASEDFYYMIFGAMAKAFGLMPASNLALMLAFLLSATSFYGACRLLHCRALWACVGAVLFAFSHYAFYRGLPHLELSYCAHVPLALVVTWRLGTGTLRSLSDRGAWIALGVAAWSGMHNAYYTNILTHLMIFALLANLARGWRDPGNRRAAGFCALALAAMLGTFVLGNLDTLTYEWINGPSPGAVERNYAGVEIYSLKPMELFLPGPRHRFLPLRSLARYYYEVSAIVRVERGEIFSPYLGIVGIAGLVWMAVAGFVRVNRSASLAKLPPGTWQIGWILLFSAMGGINCLLALCGVELFRATNRYSIFILAIALIFLARALSLRTRRWPLMGQTMLAGMLLTVGLYDQAFNIAPIMNLGVNGARVESDRAFTAAMEGRLPVRAAVFQLPVALYPEQKTIGQMTDYEHFRPYLFARTLRFSYGDTKGRGHEQWQLEAQNQIARALKDGNGEPLTAAIRALQARGFSALIIDREGYADRGAAMIEAFRRAGQRVIADAAAGDFIAFQLTAPTDGANTRGTDHAD
jgi:hypothetical protein